MRRCFLHQGVRITTLLTSLRAIPDAHRAPVLMVLALYGLVYPPIMPPPVGTFRTSRRGLPGGPGRGPRGGPRAGAPGGPAGAPGRGGPRGAPRGAPGGPPRGRFWGSFWAPNTISFMHYGGVSRGVPRGGGFGGCPYPRPARGGYFVPTGRVIKYPPKCTPPGPPGAPGGPPGGPPSGGVPRGYPGCSPGLPFPSLAVNLRLRLATPRR